MILALELAGAVVFGWISAMATVLVVARRQLRKMRGGFLLGK